jgi:hypothetical protein
LFITEQFIGGRIMRNLVSAARNRVRQPEISVRNGIKVGVKLYVVAAILMFLLGFFATISKALV